MVLRVTLSAHSVSIFFRCFSLWNARKHWIELGYVNDCDVDGLKGGKIDSANKDRFADSPRAETAKMTFVCKVQASRTPDWTRRGLHPPKFNCAIRKSSAHRSMVVVSETHRAQIGGKSVDSSVTPFNAFHTRNQLLDCDNGGMSLRPPRMIPIIVKSVIPNTDR